MNRYKKRSYFPSLASLFFLVTPGLFASDLAHTYDQSTNHQESANSNVQFSLFTDEDPLKIPDFASDALVVADNPDGSDNHAGTAPAATITKTGGDAGHYVELRLERTEIRSSHRCSYWTGIQSG